MALPSTVARLSASALLRSSAVRQCLKQAVSRSAAVAAAQYPALHRAQFIQQFSTSQRTNSLWGPKIQQRAPDFRGMAVVDGAFKEIQLSDFEGKWLVLFFYPLDFTFVCPTELIAFSDKIDEFKKIDCAVVGTSIDSHYSHYAWINMSRKQGGLGGLKYPLLSDLSKNIARSYGVLLEDAGVALRGLFIIDPKGNLRQITVNDLPVGRSVEETLRLVKAFQFTDKHGEVCPANWTPESPTIKPDPKNSQEYFGKVN